MCHVWHMCHGSYDPRHDTCVMGLLLHSHVWHDSLVMYFYELVLTMLRCVDCAGACIHISHTHLCVSHTFICVTHIHMCHTHSCVSHTFICVTHIHVCHTHSHVSHTFTCVTHIHMCVTWPVHLWLMHMCDMTPDPLFTFVTWLMANLYVRHDSWPIDMCDMTICVTWLMANVYVWHDSWPI